MRCVLCMQQWCKYLEYVGSNGHHGILVDDNDFRSRGLPCERDSHLRERLLEYKCEVKSHIKSEKVEHHISEEKIHKSKP